MPHGYKGPKKCPTEKCPIQKRSRSMGRLIYTSWLKLSHSIIFNERACIVIIFKTIITKVYSINKVFFLLIGIVIFKKYLPIDNLLMKPKVDIFLQFGSVVYVAIDSFFTKETYKGLKYQINPCRLQYGSIFYLSSFRS